MDYKQSLKTRPATADAKEDIIAFLESIKRLNITCKSDAAFPPIEFAEYRYYQGEQYLIVTPMSIFNGMLGDGAEISAFVMQGETPKDSKKFYANFTCHKVEVKECALASLAEQDRFIGHMMGHGAGFFRLEMQKGLVAFNPSQMYDLAADFTPSFAQEAPNGKPRFEHSHHVLMEYQDREVLFNSVVEGNVYYTLTKADSNKMQYIQDGGVCKFYDGAARHFESKMTVLPQEQVQVVFDKLVATNHAFFKSCEGLVALSYTYQG